MAMVDQPLHRGREEQVRRQGMQEGANIVKQDVSRQMAGAQRQQEQAQMQQQYAADVEGARGMGRRQGQEEVMQALAAEQQAGLPTEQPQQAEQPSVEEQVFQLLKAARQGDQQAGARLQQISEQKGGMELIQSIDAQLQKAEAGNQVPEGVPTAGLPQ